MKKRFLPLLLALVLCLGLTVPALATPAAEPLPEWNFLFVVFKNVDADFEDEKGATVHTAYTMPQEEIDLARENAQQFEGFLNQLGLIRAHVDVIEVDTPVTQLQESEYGSYFDALQAAPLLEGRVDLDQYDHVTSVVSLGVDTMYTGMTGSVFENGTGHSTVNLKVAGRYFIPSFPESVYVHEFLHFMEYLNLKWGKTFDLHGIQDQFYAPSHDEWKAGYTDILLNRVKGDAETGTGVYPDAWRYPPHVLRVTREFAVPDGADAIGGQAFLHLDSLERVTIPSSVAGIGSWAFAYCGSLESVIIPDGVTGIEDVTFYDCHSLNHVTIPASVTSIGEFAFGRCDALDDIYYGGGEEQWDQIAVGNYNDGLDNANVHYHSLMADVAIDDFCANSVAWALGKGVTIGTGNGAFSPEDDCTNAQILTFLWRAAGKPAAAGKAPYTAASYYQDAIDWAYGEGFLGADFDPDAACVRADAVDYIWKALGRQDAPANSFPDVADGADYAAAVDWAYANGVTNGSGGGMFGPDDVCNRGQIVTFLHRAYVEEVRLEAPKP